MRTFDDKVIAITGAGSGIGRALALELAGRGAHLALTDIDEGTLAETVGMAEGRGVKVTSETLDVADRGAVMAWAEAVADDHGRANMIVNNAGVALMADVATMDHDDFRWLMNINFWGVVNGTDAFLPHLKNSGDGHVVNISSLFGLQAIPGQAAYNSAKFAVRGFTDALRIELEVEQCGVSATTVHPGGIKTNIVRNARWDNPRNDRADGIVEFDKMARTTPEGAALKILKAVERNRRRTLIGPDAYVFDVVSRLPAAIPQRLLAAAIRRERASD